MGNYESPNYTVLRKDNAFELRHYDKFYTSSINQSSLSGNSGFGVLFSYISGKNDVNKKIAMTVPVINELKDEMSMEFVVPKEYYQDIPKPTDKRVAIKEHPEKDYAVYSFSWFSSQHKIDSIQEKLENWIKDNKWTTKGSFILARYNPPMTPPFLRKNELMIEIIQ